jgi:hypothetical protein
MTRKQIFDQIVNTLGLQDDTTFNESDFVNQLIYQAVTDILANCRPNMRVMDLTIQPDTPVHDMSSQVIAISDIALNTDRGEYFLDRFTREDITEAQQYGAKGYCYDEPMLWISPIVAEPTVIRAYGVFRPLQMLSDTDSPADVRYGGLADEFHPAIVIYCLWKAAEYVEHESSGYGEKWHLQYMGPDGNSGELGRIRKVMSKRVTAQANNSRSLAKNLGVPSNSLTYIGG